MSEANNGSSTVNKNDFNLERTMQKKKKPKKLRVLETVVFPTALYGCEAWTINNTDAKRITSFEMKCYRKILRIPWMEKCN